MLRSTPPTSEKLPLGSRALPVTFESRGTPAGEDGVQRAMTAGQNLENEASQDAAEPDGVDTEPSPEAHDFLALVREAEDQALLYQAQINRKAWSQSYRAFHNEHYVGSKYTRPDWRGRSKLFVPKTRTAVRKDLASVAASLFNNIDAINCIPGNESDPRQRASAAIMEELVNYRTDRSSGKNAIPWFLISMGARQDATLTGICMSKQSWKTEHRKISEEKVLEDDGTGVHVEKTRDVYGLEVDRPDIALIPPENFVMDPAADWTDPAQSAAYVILKWPMQVDEIVAKQNAPVNPWKAVPAEILKSSLESGKFDMAAIRRARELGIDRMDETATGTNFQIVWVYECFLRVDGEDWTFYSVGDQIFLTDPKPVREVYPEQFGERPLAFGYGQLEAHRIYPMSPVESWQPLQQETNDLRNLMLDATKQNVMPVTMVRRGRQVDLDQVKRRSSGSSILVTDPTDVTFQNPPQMPQTTVIMSRELDLELDDLAGQQNYGSVETNNALGKTLGGLKLAAGAANAVQEFDIRVWIETWATPVLSQIVRLEQYYESDPVVLGLCGQKAQLFEKYGISKIDDDLLEQDVTVRVSVGLGAGDPAQRLQKFQMAATTIAPMLQQAPEFQSGKREINIEAVCEEVFGAVGYKDGGARFFRDNPQPAQNPMLDLEQQKIRAEIAQRERQGRASLMTGLAAVAKVALGKRELEADTVDMLLGHQRGAHQLGFEHGHRQNEQVLSATEHGHRHGLAIAKHQHDVRQSLADAAREQMQGQDQESAGGDAGQGGAGAPPPPAGEGQPQASPPPPDHQQALLQMIQSGGLRFTRGPDGRINGLAPSPGGQGPSPQGEPAAPPPEPAKPAAPKADQQIDAVLARLEELENRLSKPKRIVRDPKTNRIMGVE